MSRPPTTIAVRDATVGPESGTIEVSCGAISTSSYSTPSVSATSCGKIVFVPWPISVEAVRIRMRPSSVSSTAATEASFTSPEPVKPAPCQASARPMPVAVRAPSVRPSRIARVCACVRSKADASAAASSTSMPATDSRSTWPVGCRVALAVHPAAAQVERRGVEGVGDAVDLHLGGELGLRRAEAAEGAVRRRVRGHRPTGDPHVRAPIRPAGVQHAARQHDRGERAVRAAVHDDLDLLGDQLAGVRHAGSMRTTAGWRFVVALMSSWRS
jgi:hypothetical protein